MPPYIPRSYGSLLSHVSPCLVLPVPHISPCVPVPHVFLCPMCPHVPLTSSTFLKTRIRFSASAPLTSASVQFLASSSATSAGYLETSSRPVGTLWQPAAHSCAVMGAGISHIPPRKSTQPGTRCPIPPVQPIPLPSPALPWDPIVVPTKANGLGTGHILHVVHVVCGHGGDGVSRAGGTRCHPHCPLGHLPHLRHHTAWPCPRTSRTRCRS